MKLELWYQRVWGILNIVLGLIFSVIFILGAMVLNDSKFFLYLFLTAGNAYLGWVRLNKPYVTCIEESPGVRGEIKVFSSFGTVIETYRYQSREEITVKGNRFYQGNKKLRFNSWFTNRHEWEKIKQYYSSGTLPADNLQDL